MTVLALLSTHISRVFRPGPRGQADQQRNYDCGAAALPITAHNFEILLRFAARSCSRIRKHARRWQAFGSKIHGRQECRPSNYCGAWNCSFDASWQVPQELVYGIGMALPGSCPATPALNLFGTSKTCEDWSFSQYSRFTSVAAPVGVPINVATLPAPPLPTRGMWQVGQRMPSLFITLPVCCSTWSPMTTLEWHCWQRPVPSVTSGSPKSE